MTTCTAVTKPNLSVEGHSNGASQLAYSMTRYGMAEYLDLAVFESGPNWTRLDQSCIQDDPAFSDIFFLSSSRIWLTYPTVTSMPRITAVYTVELSYRSILEYDSPRIGKLAIFLPEFDGGILIW